MILLLNAKKKGGLFSRSICSISSVWQIQTEIERRKGSKTALAFADRLICDDAATPKTLPQNFIRMYGRAPICAGKRMYAVAVRAERVSTFYRRNLNIFIILITTFEFIALRTHMQTRTMCRDRTVWRNRCQRSRTNVEAKYTRVNLIECQLCIN